MRRGERRGEDEKGCEEEAGERGVRPGESPSPVPHYLTPAALLPGRWAAPVPVPWADRPPLLSLLLTQPPSSPFPCTHLIA